MPLDIGVGILLALGVSHSFAIPFTPFLALFGVASALFPDIDIVTALFGRWRHRKYTHYPLLYIPVFILVYILLPHAYAALFIIGVVYHLIHDTIGTGWGIVWLWPFSKRHFLLFPYKRIKEMGWWATWTPQEKPEWKHTGPQTWVRTIYFRPSPIAFIEYGGLLLSIALLVLYLSR